MTSGKAPPQRPESGQMQAVRQSQVPSQAQQPSQLKSQSKRQSQQRAQHAAQKKGAGQKQKVQQQKGPQQKGAQAQQVQPLRPSRKGQGALAHAAQTVVAPRQQAAGPATRRPALAQPSSKQAALWQQLQQAAWLVQAVMQGRSAPTVLDELSPAQRAGVQALGYLALRRLGVARWLREQLVPRTPPPAVEALLCTALALAWEPKLAVPPAASGALEGDGPSSNALASSAAEPADGNQGEHPHSSGPATAAQDPARVERAVLHAGAASDASAVAAKGLPSMASSVAGHASGASALSVAANSPLAAQGGAGQASDQACNMAEPAAQSAVPSAQLDLAPYNDFTLVHQAVEAARRHPRMRHQAGLVNACLRAFMREREAWQARCHQAAPQGRAELLNLPAWWWQRLQLDYPGLVDPASVYPANHAANMVDTAEDASTAASDAASQRGSFTASAGHERASAVTSPQSQAMSMAAAIALAGQHPPPMHLRVNARCMSPAQYLHEHLLPAGLAGQLHGDYGIMLRKPCSVQQLPGFAQGWVSVQDAAAQLAAPLLLHALQQQTMSQPVTQPVKQARVQSDAQSGAPLGTRWRLLDACAAPGGKTAHLLELGEHDVTALDIDAARCARIRENLQRLALHAQVQVADAGQPAAWWNGQRFDGILLDAPCSASGIVRRHPDIAWLRREADIAQLVRTQQQLLHALWPLLRPGGVLLYATCSVFRAEGQDQVDAFLARHNDAASLPAPGHLLPTSGLAAAGLGHNGPQAVSEKALLHGAQAAQSAVQAAGAANNPQWLDHDGFYYALLVKTV